MNAFAALGAVVVLLGSCAPREPQAEPDGFEICTTDMDFVETMVRELAAHGIKCQRGGHVHFMWTGVFVRGSLEEAFRGREVVLENVRTRGWKVGWPADAIILPDDPRYDKQISVTPQSWVRMANVTFSSTPTRRVIDVLKRQGIEAEIFFGDRIDIVTVHLGDFERVAPFLRKETFPGVEIPAVPR